MEYDALRIAWGAVVMATVIVFMAVYVGKVGSDFNVLKVCSTYVVCSYITHMMSSIMSLIGQKVWV